MTATDYSTYLRIDELLALQQPLTPGADDEMLFIIVHQAYELWFKLVIHELDLAREKLLAGEPWLAVPYLRRAVAVEELLYQQLGVLETMTPEGFLVFRDPLAPASGFQSSQFREIVRMSGGSDVDDEGLGVAAPNLWDGVVASLDKVVPAPAGGRSSAETAAAGGAGRVLGLLLAVYREHATAERAAMHQICEVLVDHDEVIARWRHRHALMAAREIGRRQGTGGSLGVGYLETTLDRRFYPLLWEVRSQL
jgi:tryptophan 2,3-dioxygenase